MANLNPGSPQLERKGFLLQAILFAPHEHRVLQVERAESCARACKCQIDLGERRKAQVQELDLTKKLKNKQKATKTDKHGPLSGLPIWCYAGVPV